MLRRIETACENQDAVLYGIMEINETYRGDKAGNKCAQKKPHAENNNGSGKQIQIAMHERNVAEEQSSTKRHAQQKIAKSGGGKLWWRPPSCCVLCQTGFLLSHNHWRCAESIEKAAIRPEI